MIKKVMKIDKIWLIITGILAAIYAWAFWHYTYKFQILYPLLAIYLIYNAFWSKQPRWIIVLSGVILGIGISSVLSDFDRNPKLQAIASVPCSVKVSNTTSSTVTLIVSSNDYRSKLAKEITLQPKQVNASYIYDIGECEGNEPYPNGPLHVITALESETHKVIGSYPVQNLVDGIIIK